MTANEDFLFTQEAMALGFVTDAQVKETFELQKRMAEDLKLDERVSVILVKRGYMGEDQARRVYAKIEPKKGGTGQIQGYRLLEIVGRGAMGTVYRAIHLGLKREVALKILRQDLAGDRTQVERLRKEAEMLASLDHPNIVRALDAGESNGFPYVAMEFIEGETLRDLVRREGALPEDEALRIARALADALERARRMGVVHRDVKPGNVLMAKNGTPKLMDFGLAKGPVDLGLTQHGATVGTPQYIAPEQAIDPRKADTRSDIYALGATLYAMLTGRPPFDGQTLAEILTKVLYETPTPVRVVRPEISLETGYLVERMMLRDPSLRYRTPAMVAHDIDRLTQGASILPTGFSGNWEAYLLRKRVRRTLVLGGAAAVLVAGGWFTVSWVERIRERDQQTISVEKEIGSLLDAERPTLSDSRGTVVRRLNRAQVLLRRAEELHPPSERALAQRVLEWTEEEDRFARVADTERLAKEAEQRGDEAGADALYEKLLADPALVTGPAQSAAVAAREKLGDRSDEALRAERRKMLSAPATMLATLPTIVGAWRDRVAKGFASTPERSVALRKATAANDAARLLAAAGLEALEGVSSERIAERVKAWQFSELRSDLDATAKRLQEAMRDWKGPLTDLEQGPSEAQISALLQVPLGKARATAERTVAEERDRVIESATDLHKKGDSTRALEVLAGFVKSAREAHPEAAQRAHDLHVAIDTQSREAREASARALEQVVAAFLGDLRAYDLARASARLAEARARSDVDLRAALDELERYPARYEQFYARALKGLAARVGPERSKWLEPVALRDGTVGRFWEIRAVDPDTRKFVVASHSGGAVVGVLQTHELRDLADEEIWRLGDVGDQAPEDLVLRALRILATWPDADPDLYRRKNALQAVVAAFERAGLGRGALANWAAARLEAVNDRVADDEKLAKNSLDSAKDLLARALYSQANWHFGQLKDELRFTQVARDNALYIDDQLKRIRGELKLDEIASYIVASVQRVGGGDPDLPIVNIHVDFDTKEELANFTTGVGRLERSSVAPVVTPNRPIENWRLLLLPDEQGTVVKDQPLGMRCPFDATSERWISFVYSSMTPVFLGIDLDGVQVGILSADPSGYAFPHDIPTLKDERKPPPLNHYGRGRGVMFRTWTPKPGDKNAFGDPSTWPWDKDAQGRHVLAPRKPDVLEKKLFAFEANKQYRVKFVHQPEQGRVALLVDDREVWFDASVERWKNVKSSGRLQILTFTTCAIDDLTISGRISREWLDEMKEKNEKRSTSGTHELVPPKAPK